VLLKALFYLGLLVFAAGGFDVDNVDFILASINQFWGIVERC
jgi:hypothetical protein